MTIKVAVVDDQEIVRAGFAALLGTQKDFRVVGTAADGEEAVELCRTQRPHVVLMDVRMPVMDGIEATRRVTTNGKRPPRVIVLTTFDLDEVLGLSHRVLVLSRGRQRGILPAAEATDAAVMRLATA